VQWQVSGGSALFQLGEGNSRKLLQLGGEGQHCSRNIAIRKMQPRPPTATHRDNQALQKLDSGCSPSANIGGMKETLNGAKQFFQVRLGGG
jgi:hypothetical protein